MSGSNDLGQWYTNNSCLIHRFYHCALAVAIGLVSQEQIALAVNPVVKHFEVCFCPNDADLDMHTLIKYGGCSPLCFSIPAV
jgi:hypothetical protein